MEKNSKKINKNFDDFKKTIEDSKNNFEELREKTEMLQKAGFLKQDDLKTATVNMKTLNNLYEKYNNGLELTDTEMKQLTTASEKWGSVLEAVLKDAGISMDEFVKKFKDGAFGGLEKDKLRAEALGDAFTRTT